MERFSERSSRDSSNNVDKVKEPWRSQSYALGGGEPFSSCLLGGFSWPPRTYTCTFCKREFRSAQALGGHMNVHRRDRARLRQSPPWDPPLDDPRPDLNLIPSLCSNPNPNPRAHLVPNLNMSPPCHANGKISSNGIPHLTSSPTSHASGAKFSTIAFPSLVSPLQCFSSASSSVSSAEPSGPKVDILRSTAQAVKYLFRREEELESLRDEEGRSHEQALVGRQVMRLDMEMEEGLDLELRLGHS